MRKTAIGFLFVLAASPVIVAETAGQTASSWVSYRSPDARFAARFPTVPMNQLQESATKEGQPIKQQLISAQEGDNVFMVGYFEIGSGQTFDFADARDGMVKNVGGTLLLETPITAGPYTGLDMVVSFSVQSTAGVIIARIIRTPKRAYVVQALYPANAPYQAEKTATFFRSFQILAD